MRERTTAAILDHLTFIYGAAAGRAAYHRLRALLDRVRSRLPAPRAFTYSERDAILITYGDMVRTPGTPPLNALADFCRAQLSGAISAVHLLPFFPYSSDDGFSVIDYQTVDPALGTWQDLARLGAHFQLMFDLVINHVSAQSEWFRRFLEDDPRFREYFSVIEPGTDLSAVFRPRALPLLTPVRTASGEKLVWTTFSPDQVDLNFANPDVLLEILEILLLYVERGATYIRLDAIAFLWKEIGTASIHLPQTHRVVQLIRAVLDEVAPQVAVITETNVPHQDNISYFGDGTNEAQLVYNFSLPPLVLHAIHSGDATTLSGWARTLATPSDRTAFFNFLASHDGIGVTPARGILSPAALDALGERVAALGGYVSYRNNPDGSQSAYELNINYLDALGDPNLPDEDPDLIARRFLVAQAIMLALRGVPGIYFHSLVGSRSWQAGVAQTGRYRTINREKLSRAQLELELADRQTLRHKVFAQFKHLLRQRAARPAFHPTGRQQILSAGESVFGLLRGSPDDRDHVLCLHNVSRRPQRAALRAADIPFTPGTTPVDIVTGQPYPAMSGDLPLKLEPYQTLWLHASAG